MKFNLLLNYYIDKNEERAKELNFCLSENLKNRLFNNVIIICSQNEYDCLKYNVESELLKKIVPVIVDIRPSYNDYFKITQFYPDAINVISNLDIIIPQETLIKSLNYFSENKNCLGLTRYDIQDINDYKQNSVFFDRVDSQDTWMFKGTVKQMNNAYFGLGIAGCDNAILNIIEENGYNFLNPSLSLKTYHYHTSNIRNYVSGETNEVIKRINLPYKTIAPTT